MPTEQAVGLFLEQDALLPGKIAAGHTPTLTALIAAISVAFKAGGRCKPTRNQPLRARCTSLLTVCL